MTLHFCYCIHAHESSKNIDVAVVMLKRKELYSITTPTTGSRDAIRYIFGHKTLTRGLAELWRVCSFSFRLKRRGYKYGPPNVHDLH